MVCVDDKHMNCPRCGHKQTCPCKACQKRNPTEKPWVWKGEDIHCAVCDLTTDWLKVEADWIEFLKSDEWRDIAYKNHIIGSLD